MLLISHDRNLIELTADRLWLVAAGRVRPFDGDLEDYHQSLLAGRANDAPGGGGAEPSLKRAQRQRGAALRAELAPLRQAASAAERELERLSAEPGQLAARLADGATYQLSGDELAALLKREAELKAAIAAAEHRWLDAAEALERARRLAGADVTVGDFPVAIAARLVEIGRSSKGRRCCPEAVRRDPRRPQTEPRETCHGRS